MATSTGQKWLIGCGIGCGAIVLVLVLLATGTCVLVKGVVDDISGVEESSRALVEAFGEPEEFTPAADGSIAPERIETFLAVREQLEESRDELHRLFDEFPPDEGSGLWMAFKVIGGLAGMFDDVVAFIDARNVALLHSDMGYGEYLYIYFVVYYAWLEHEPGDGPMHDGERIFSGDDSTFGVRKSSRGYRKLMLAFLRNQLEALPADADDAWRVRLVDEIDATERDGRHVAWRGGLPSAIEAALAPFRRVLEVAYDEETNCFELPTDEREGVQWRID